MEGIDYKTLLEEIYIEIEPLFGRGQVASYIPELGRIDGHQFGMSICKNNGEEFVIGDCDKDFSIQSISKLYTFALAYKTVGVKLWDRLGREPSGTKFNSLILLEQEKGIPRNPFINSGALVVADILLQEFSNPMDAMLEFIKEISGNPDVCINEKMKNSELACSYTNYALAFFMKSFGNINSDVDSVLELYTSLCAIEMDCVDLARSIRVFSSNGLNPWNNERILTMSESKRINAVMMTCGLYNGVGDFAYRVGIPAKSGVGGGIVGVIPGEMSIATWAPELDHSGNSLIGLKALEIFTTRTGLSIY